MSLLFLLDQNVDIAVGRVIRKAGHRCVHAGEIGLADASDEDVSIWADDKHAVVLTHDNEFIQRRKEKTYGRHVQLVCAEEDAPSVVEAHLADIVAKLDGHDSIVLRVSPDRVIFHAGQWPSA